MITLKCHKCAWESSGYDPATMKTEYYSHLNAHEEAPHNGAFFMPQNRRKSVSRPAKTLSDIWDIYLTYRMAPLPGAGAFMSAISPQGEILDVQDFFRKEFNAVIEQVKADTWDEVATWFESERNSPGSADEVEAANPYREANDD